MSDFGAEFVSALAGAIVGGCIAGFFSILATKQMLQAEREKDSEEEERTEFGLLQALHDELDVVYERYKADMAPRIDTLMDGQPLLIYFPIHQDYFPIYRGNTSIIGRIKNNDLRRSIVEVYTKAAGMVDTFKMNNELIQKYENYSSLCESTKQPAHQGMCQAQYKVMADYAKGLKAAHSDLKADIQNLLWELNKRGVITEIDHSAEYEKHLYFTFHIAVFPLWLHGS
jgi:hypothetical protein